MGRSIILVRVKTLKSDFKRFLVVSGTVLVLGWVVLLTLVLQTKIDRGWLWGYAVGQLFALSGVAMIYLGVSWQLRTLRKSVFVLVWVTKSWLYIFPFLIYDWATPTVGFWGVLTGLLLVVTSNSLTQYGWASSLSTRFNQTSTIRLK